MNLTQLYTLIGDLTNDPNHDRYSTSQIDTELDTTQDIWNVEAGIVTDTVTLTTVADTVSVALSGLTGTLIDITRATHKGLPLKRISKQYLDLYSGTDWTTSLPGTPTAFAIDLDPDVMSILLNPIPSTNDAGANLVIEYVKRHTSMTNSTDTPFMSATTSSSLLTPYHYGIAYDVAGRLLTRDVNTENAAKAQRYTKIAKDCLADVVQIFKGLSKEKPLRMSGGRSWR